MVKSKKGAMSLSIGTIVIIVLAMTMLILGIMLVRTIFSGAKYNVDTTQLKVQNEINKLFTEDEKMVVYLANQKLDIKQGKDWGVGFGLKNLIRETTSSKKFDYEVSVNMDSVNLKNSCGGLTVKEAESWIKAGKSSSLTLSPGETGYDTIRFSIPEGAPLCFVRYSVTVDHPDIPGSDIKYVSKNFDVNIEG
tara:strand:- start:42 stop:620 length:579 start_codon:yes stop_codon:yes gene_type:complete